MVYIVPTPIGQRVIRTGNNVPDPDPLEDPGDLARLPQEILDEIRYSDIMDDGVFEYRDVTIPKRALKYLPSVPMTADVIHIVPIGRKLTEREWRSLGINMSDGWQNYMVHNPQRSVLLFRRPHRKVIDGVPQPFSEEQKETIRARLRDEEEVEAKRRPFKEVAERKPEVHYTYPPEVIPSPFQLNL